MKKKLIFVTAIIYSVIISYAQLAPELNHLNPDFVVQKWDASWICCHEAPKADYAVTLYRKSFDLAEKSGRFIIHVSADNRYKLYVNGVLCSIGPQLSDTRHWRYETFDIAPYLQTGVNVLAAEVANWGPDRFFGIMSLRTGFILQGFSKTESVVNTDANWKARHNRAFSPVFLNWMNGVDIVGGFYASNPGDSIDVANYPVNWQKPGFNDSNWGNAEWIYRASRENESGHHWLLKARTTPQVVQNTKRFSKIARTSGIVVPPDFISGESDLTIPANSKASLLIDNETVSIGFPEMKLSGGKGGKLTIRYAENLLLPDLSKGDRNVVEGKSIRGIRDVIVPDGRSFVYSPLWYRAFRFVQIDVETGSEPLTINDFIFHETVSPMERKATFDCDDPDYLKIDEICWHTAKICTQDNLLSDAYYEQMMYVGDSKVHALVNLYLSGDTTWLRNAIEQFGYSQMTNGLITSCYPVRATILHINYTLTWIEMMHDYLMYCRDKQFLANYTNAIWLALDWFDKNRLPNGLVGKPVGRYFIDWYHNTPWAGRGTSPASAEGNSATISLQYAVALMKAAEIFETLEMKESAAGFRQRAETMKQAVFSTCWDTDKKLFAENPGGTFYDGRANILAINSGLFDKDFSKNLLENMLSDTAVNHAGYFFRYHYFDALRLLNAGEKTDQLLDIWKDLLPLNYTTTPERLARQRSDAHPWSAYPSVAFLKVVAGIAPATPGFASVSIKPALGKLNYVNASYPHYLGNISVNLKKTGTNGLSGNIILPKGLNGTFEFKGKTIALQEGVQEVKF
jgi:alpha-L-rhamnosidase